MISRELAINLGITLVFSIGLFVYFNSKVNKVENKINAVFKIIQQHNNNNNNNNNNNRWSRSHFLRTRW